MYLWARNIKNFAGVLSYIENWLLLVSTATTCVSISDFGSLVDIPVGFTSSASITSRI